MSTPTVYVICDNNCHYEGMTREQIIAAIAEATGATPTEIDDAFITKLKPSGESVNLTAWFGTQAEFNALSPAPTTKQVILKFDTTGKAYIVKDDESFENVPNDTITISEIDAAFESEE